MASTYTVRKGDCLSMIAQTYLSTIRSAAGNSSLGVYTPNGGATQKLADWNGIKTTDYIFVGQVLKLGPDSSSSSGGSSSTSSSASKPEIDVFGVIANADRSLYCTWKWSKEHTANFVVTWRYQTGNGVWFKATEETKAYSDTTKYSLYENPPDNAVKVKIEIYAVPDTYKDSNNNDVYYWKIGGNPYSGTTEYEYILAPAKPSTPEAELDGTRLTATLENIDVNIANSIEFQIVKNNSDIVGTYTSKITYNYASIVTTVAAGNRYGVRCRSVNGNLKSTWSDFVYVDSKPAGIPEITVCKSETYNNNSSAIRLEWTSVDASNTTNNPLKYEVQYTTEKRYFDVSESVTSKGDITGTTYIFTGLSAGSEYFFRVRATNTKGNGDWSSIKSVTLGKKPSIPSTWSSTNTASPGDSVTFYWSHNSEDGSSQQYAILSYKFDSSSVWTDIPKYTSTEEDGEKTMYHTFNIPLNSDGGVISWRVKTAGIKKDSAGNPEYSDWSITRSIDVYANPILEITVKDYNNDTLDVLDGNGIIEAFPFYVYAAVQPLNQTPITYHISIVANETYISVDSMGNPKTVSSGEEVYSKNFEVSSFAESNGAWRNFVEFSANNVTLDNNVEYTIVCTVGMNSGLIKETTAKIRTEWSEWERTPNADVIINNDDLTAHICPYCKDEEDELIDGVTLSVYRREFDGSFTELATNIPNDEATYIKDPHPSLDYARYRIVVKTTSNGSISYYDPPGYFVGESSAVIQWDEIWSKYDAINPQNGNPVDTPNWGGSVVKLPYNLDVSNSYNPDVSFVNYIGRKNPVSYYGTHIGEKATWNVDIEKDDILTLYALRKLANWMGNVYVREPSGSGYWANVVVSFNQTHCELTIPVSLSITRVEGGI